MIKQLIEKLEEVKGSVETTINTSTMTVSSHCHLAPGISEAIKIAQQLQAKVRCESCKYWASKNTKIGLCNNNYFQCSFWPLPTNKEELMRVKPDFGCKFWEKKE